jgi:hypothetical protein
MMEVLVMLDFACCSCEEPIGVTLKSEGEGLTQRSRKVAAVGISCPHCGQCNRVYFEPNGTLRDVAPVPEMLPEPSIN